MITESHQAESILSEGKADVVIVARELLRDAGMVLRWARELGVEVEWPVQCEFCELARASCWRAAGQDKVAFFSRIGSLIVLFCLLFAADERSKPHVHVPKPAAAEGKS